MSAEIPDLKRIQFFNGERLTAGDLTSVQDAARELRWLHNRSLHGWGIASGLQVDGSRGDRSVKVSPGYAVDCLGRELILSRSLTMAIPAAAGQGGEVRYYLVASWVGDSDQDVLERRSGTCSGEGAVRLSDEPLIAWRSPSALEEGIEIILAEIWIQNCKLSRDVSSASRRYARPSQQPYIAGGQTTADDTVWHPWTSGQQFLGVRATVDTSAARFRTTPQYFANVAGSRYLAVPPGPLFAIGFTAAADPQREQFTLQVMLPDGPGNINPNVLHSQAPELLKVLGWHIVWMGIED